MSARRWFIKLRTVSDQTSVLDWLRKTR